jgi:formate hydrogenlyase subunit 6/NADH:ubiquinone oxidoreductase subunit I
MKIGAMFGDVFRSLFKKPITERYPFEKKPAPLRLLLWDPAKCTGCQLCLKDCPADAIELLIIDKATKKFVLRYHADRCTYCAQCLENCRFKCLSMSHELWELASTQKEDFIIHYGKEEDITFILAKAAEGRTGASGED